MSGALPKLLHFLIGVRELIKGVSRFAIAKSADFITGKTSENNFISSPSKKVFSFF